MDKFKITFEGTGELQPDGSMRVIGILASTQGLELPTIVGGLQLLEVTESRVRFSFNDNGDASQWKIYRDGLLYDTISSSIFEDNAVSADTEYVYQVKPSNAAGDGPLSVESLTVETLEPDLPEPPVLSIGDVTAFFIELSWTTEVGVFEWDIYRAVVPAGPVLFTTLTVATYIDDTVDDNTEYEYTIVARSPVGDSDPSDAASATTPDNQPPQWFATADVSGTIGDGYTLDLKTLAIDPEGRTVTFSLFSGSLPTGLSLDTGTGVVNGTFSEAGPFAPVFRASDGDETADFEMTFTIAGEADTTPPTDPAAYTIEVNGSTLTHRLGTPSTDASGIGFYRIRRGGVVVNNNVIFPWVEQNVPNGSYLCEVRAFDASPAHNFTAFIPGTPNPVVVNVSLNPDSPINFLLVAQSSTQINSSWQAGPSGPAPTLYRLERSLTGNSPQAAPGTSGWTSSFAALGLSDTDTGLTSETQYFYRLRAEAGALVSGWIFANTFTSGSALIIAQGSDNPPWPHGGGSMGPNGTNNIATWESWMGHAMEIYTEWFGQGTFLNWSQLENYNAPKVKDAINFFVGSAQRLAMPIVVRTPLLPNSAPDSNKNLQNPSTWDRAAAGNYTSHWAPCAETLRDLCLAKGRNPNSIIWSLGWEFTGNWYPWAIGSKLAQYKIYFGLVVDEIRSVIPQARIDWPPARTRGAGNNTLANLAPDPSKFNFISRSAHDGGTGGFADPAKPSAWNAQLNGSTGDIGLAEVAALARTLGKKICLSEWASQWADSGDDHGPAPHPDEYYKQMWDTFLFPNRDIVAYDTLFQPSDCAIYKSSSNPVVTAARNMFKNKWRQP